MSDTFAEQVKKLPKESGIYWIECERIGAYVGRATDIRTRVRKEYSQLRTGKHHNRNVQMAWDDFGEECFSVEVLELCLVEGCAIKETEYIVGLWGEEGLFNIASTGRGGHGGFEWSAEARIEMSNRSKEQWAGAEARAAQSERTRRYFENNPDAGRAHSEWMLRYFEDNPDAGSAHADAVRAHYANNPEARKELSKSVRAYYAENPEAVVAMAARANQHWACREHRAAMSKLKLQYNADNPGAGLEHSRRMRKRDEDNPEAAAARVQNLQEYWKNPRARSAMAESKRQHYVDNPEALGALLENSRQYWSKPESRQAQSEQTRTYYKNNPQAGEAHGKKMRENMADPIRRAEILAKAAATRERNKQAVMTAVADPQKS